MDELDSEIRRLARRHLDTDEDTLPNLLRRLERQMERDKERVRLLENALAGTGEALQRLANTGDIRERSSLADTLKGT